MFGIFTDGLSVNEECIGVTLLVTRRLIMNINERIIRGTNNP